MNLDDKRLSVAVYQPDIPQNLGSMIRTCTCLGADLHIIGPCGFPFSDDKLRRVGMDYIELSSIFTYLSWHDFVKSRVGIGRMVLLSTKSDVLYTEHDYLQSDILIVGRESSGVPASVHSEVDARVRIPMFGSARSLNVVVAASIVLSEMKRQICM